MRVLITGSRTWRDARRIRDALNWITRNHRGPHTLVHGAARGADTIAARHARRLGWMVEGHEVTRADWDAPCTPDCKIGHRRPRADGTTYCPQAGNRRNQRMVDLGADLVLAYIRNNSRGATNCADAADAAGLDVRRVRSN